MQRFASFDTWDKVSILRSISLDCKESACNAGDTDSFPGLERYPGEENSNSLQYSWDFPGGSEGKISACNADAAEQLRLSLSNWMNLCRLLSATEAFREENIKKDTNFSHINFWKKSA